MRWGSEHAWIEGKGKSRWSQEAFFRGLLLLLLQCQDYPPYTDLQCLLVSVQGSFRLFSVAPSVLEVLRLCFI